MQKKCKRHHNTFIINTLHTIITKTDELWHTNKQTKHTHTHTRTHTPSPKLFCVHTHLSPQILNSLPKPNCRQESKGNKLVVRAVMLVSSRIRIGIFESCLCVLESGLS